MLISTTSIGAARDASQFGPLVASAWARRVSALLLTVPTRVTLMVQPCISDIGGYVFMKGRREV